jgi:MATE family multidrug resistance protein
MLQVAAELSAFAMATFMIGWMGETPLAASQIVTQLAVIVIMVPYGISQSSSVLIGQALGRRDYEDTRKLGEAALLLGFIFALGVAFLYWIFPHALIRLFSLNAHNPAVIETIRLAVILLAIDAICEILDALRNIAIGALRGFHDSTIPMVNSVIVCWVISLPLGYVFGFWFKWGVVGMKIAFLIAVTFGAITMIRRLYQRTRELR